MFDCIERLYNPSLHSTLGCICPVEFELAREVWGAVIEPARFGVLLYDLTWTCFGIDLECEPDKLRQFGYRRGNRRKCRQVVIALIVTPWGLASGLRGAGGQHR